MGILILVIMLIIILFSWLTVFIALAALTVGIVDICKLRVANIKSAYKAIRKRLPYLSHKARERARKSKEYWG